MATIAKKEAEISLLELNYREVKKINYCIIGVYTKKFLNPEKYRPSWMLGNIMKGDCTSLGGILINNHHACLKKFKSLCIISRFTTDYGYRLLKISTNNKLWDWHLLNKWVCSHHFAPNQNTSTSKNRHRSVVNSIKGGKCTSLEYSITFIGNTW